MQKNSQGSIEEVSNAFTETLKNSELQSITYDLSEIGLDVLINNEILKEIPIIKSLISLKQGVSQVQDRLLLKKIIAFLSQAKNIEAEDRAKVINQINSSKKYRLKVGEQLLYLIDKCDDWEKSELLSIFFNAFIKDQITYEDFIKSSKIIEMLTIYELKEFRTVVSANKDEYFTINSYGEASSDITDLLNSGLFTYYVEEVRVEDEDDWEMNRKYKTEGGNIVIQTSTIGKKIFTVLTDFYS